MRSSAPASRIRSVLLALIPGTVFSLPAAAHPPVEHQIETVSAAIAAAPTAARFLERAELLRIAGRCDDAMTDCDEAVWRGASLADAALVRARVALDCGDPAAAEDAARAAIDAAAAAGDAGSPAAAAFPRVAAHRALAAALARQNRPAESAAAFEQAAAAARAATEDTGPEDFLSAAAQWEAAGQPDRALAALDVGLEQLGPLPVLQSAAVRTARDAGRTEEALLRLDRLIAEAPRPEEWLAEKGRTLQQAGRAPEAWAAFSEALAALDRLPPAHRNTPAARRLEAELRAALTTEPRS